MSSLSLLESSRERGGVRGRDEERFRLRVQDCGESGVVVIVVRAMVGGVGRVANLALDKRPWSRTEKEAVVSN
jgi:hypothetical protein